MKLNYFSASALYNPSVLLKDPKIGDLLKYIWQESNTISYSQALKSQEFCACKEKFKNCEKLLFEVLKDVIAAIKLKIPKNYEVLKDQIGYKEQLL